MSYMVVAHHPTTSSVELWATQYLPNAFTMGMSLRISRGGVRLKEIPLPGWSGWEIPGGEPNDLKMYTHALVVDGLEPGSEYDVELLSGGFKDIKASAHFETLPARLPPTDSTGVDG